MTRELVLRDSDSKTVDLPKQEAEQADTTARAKRIILVDSTGSIIKLTRSRENLSGSAGTGSDGDANRVFTLITTNAVDIVEVFLDGVLLVETSQYSKSNVAKTVTISLNVFNTQIVTVVYNV